MLSLGEADRLRTIDRARALDAYAARQHEIGTDDRERVLWICAQVAPTPPAALEPLLERVVREGPSDLERAAVHGRATIAWFDGRASDAERHWRRGLRFADAPRDRFWIRSALNLATVLFQRHRLFEPLVLAGMGRRAARDANHPDLAAYGALRRAEVLLRMGAVDEARRTVAAAAEDQAHVTEDGQCRVVDYELSSVSSEIDRAAGELETALAARDRQLDALERYGRVEAPILAGVHMARLRLLYDLEPERRAETLAALESLPERFALGPAWAADWRRDLLDLELRHALDEHRKDDAHALARQLVALLRRAHRNDLEVMHAAALGHTIARDLDDAALAAEAYALGSEVALLRVLAAKRAERDLPELAEATPEDWYVMRDYRTRLENEQRDLLDAVAADVKPGAPAFELLVHEEMIRICAWCYRVRTNEDAWLPIAHFIPPNSSFQATHGICEACRGNHFPEGVT